MADPPPPSYDEAITGHFSAPPPSSTPPPPPFSPPPSFLSPPPPETSTPLPPFSPIPSSECFSEIPSYLNGESSEPLNRRTNNINNLRTSDPYEGGANPSVGSGSNKVCKKLAFGIVVLGVVLAAVLYLVVPSNQSGGNNCKSDPPIQTIGSELRLSYCSANEEGEYEHGSKCAFECKSGFSIYVYNHRGYPQEDFTYPHYACHKTKWEYYPLEKNLNFQCLPLSKSTQDCELKDLTKEIIGSTRPELIDCPHKSYRGYNKNKYFTGTKCTLQCPTDYIMFVQNSGKKLEQGPQSVDFTCQNSTWVSTTNVHYKNKQCFKKMSSSYDCGNTLGVELKNCPENNRGGYFQGTKCDIVECEENYSLYAYGNNSLLYYNSKAVLEPINAKLQVTCEKKSWRKSNWKATLDDGTRLEDKRFQCLPPSNASNDCPKWPQWFYDIKLDRNVHGGNLGINGRFYCPINDRGQYSEGTVCTWQCEKGNYLYNKKLKTKNLPTKMSNFHYTCNNSQWVSSLSKEFRKGFLYCVD